MGLAYLLLPFLALVGGETLKLPWLNVIGLLATIGHERPPNLVHVLLDNQRHERDLHDHQDEAACCLAFLSHCRVFSIKPWSRNVRSRLYETSSGPRCYRWEECRQ